MDTEQPVEHRLTWTSVDELFRAEFPRLVRNLALVDGIEAATDAVQEAFIRADRHWNRVQALSDPIAWVRRVALNRLLNGRRNRLRRSEILAALRPVPEAELSPVNLDLLAAIRGLPRRQRAVVCLVHLSDLPVEQVAADLGIAPGTVRSHLHDARVALRRTLEVPEDA
jgi:RNA polymerase sigma-70 factor (ECF subfamily)